MLWAKAAVDWSRRRWVPLSAGLVGLGILAGAGLMVLAWTPTYTFPLDESDPATVREAVGLARELRRIDDALARRHDPAAARAVLAWMRLPHNAAAARWVDLARSAPEGADPDQAQRFAIANDYLLRLEFDASAPRPATLRAIDERERARSGGDPAAAEKAILAWQAEGAQADRLRARTAAVRRPSTVALVGRLGWSPWPWPGQTPAREFARRVLGRPTLGDVWTAALLASAPRAEYLASWYDRLDGLREIPFGPSLVLRPLRSSSVPTIHHEGLATRIDVEVWRRGPVEGEPDQVGFADTGIRFNGVLPIASTSGSGEIQATLDQRTVTVVDGETFNRFLHGLGLPPTVTASELEPARTSEGGVTTVRLGARLRHAQFSSLSWPVTLRIDSAGQADPTAEILSWRDDALTRLVDHLVRVDRIHDWKVKFGARDDGGSPTAPATLEVPGVGSMSLRVRATAEGRLTFADATTLEERTRLAKALTEQNEKLRPLAAWVVPGAATFRAEAAPGVLCGQLSVRVSGSVPGETDLSGVTWSIHPDGRTEVVIPAQTPPAVLAGWSRRLAAPAVTGSMSPPTTPAARRRTSAELTEEIRAELGRFCDPALRERVEVAPPVEANGQSLVSLGLKLADWPGLTLGPRAIGPDEPAGPAVRAMLDESEVIRRAGEVWAAGGDHPRYGPVASRLTAFSAESGTARVESTLPIWNDFKVSWPQVLSAAKGLDWGALSERGVQGALDQAGVRDLVRRTSADLASATLGLDFEARVDENGFGPGRWLRFDPPAVALTARIQPISWLPFKAAVEHVTLGAPGGLNFDQTRAEVRRHGTLFLPTLPVGISDLGFGVDMKNRGLSVLARITPPTLHLMPGPGNTPDPGHEPGEWLQGQEGTASDPGAAENLAAMNVDVSSLPPALRQKLRLDNLWLNLAHVDLSLGLGIDRLDLRGDGDLNLIGSRAARAETRLDVQDKSFEGTMATDETAAAYLPRMNGKIAINQGGRGGFVANGRINLAAVDAGVQVDYPTSKDDQEKRLHLRGRATLPLLGTVQLHGHSDLQFQNPVLESYGMVEIDDPKLGKVEATVHLDGHGYEVTTSWFTPRGGKLSRTFRGTSLDEAEGQRIRGELAQTIAQSRATAQEPRPADPAEIAAVEPISVTERVKPWVPNFTGNGPGLSPVKSEKDVFPSAGLAAVSLTDQDKTLEDGRVVIRKNGKKVVDLPLAALGLRYVKDTQSLRLNVPMTYWDLSEGSGALLVVDTYDRDASLFRLANSTTIQGSPEPPGPEFAPLGPIVPTTNDSETMAKLTLNKQVLVSVISARLVGNSVQRIERMGTGALITLETPPVAGVSGKPESLGIAVRLTEDSGLRARLAFLYGWLTPPSAWAEFATRFPKLPPPDEDVGVLAFRPGEGPGTGVAWLRSAPSPPADAVLDGKKGDLFYEVNPTADAPGTLPLRLESMRDPDARTQFLTLRRLVEASWSGGLPEPVAAGAGSTTSGERKVSMQFGLEPTNDGLRIRQLGPGSPLAGGRAVAGPRGLAVLPAEGPGRVAGLWLAPRLAHSESPATGPGAARVAFWMPRTAFLAWEDGETSPLLPQALSVATARGEVSLPVLAAQAVRAWELNRETWGAEPMTLLARVASPELRTSQDTTRP